MTELNCISLEYCNDGNRGIFASRSEGAIAVMAKKDLPFTESEIAEMIGVFSIILDPKPEVIEESKLSEFTKWKPLAEFSHGYGILTK